MSEQAITKIDNSYNPPIRDLYCGICEAFVYSSPIYEPIPNKLDVICSSCQDKGESND